MTGIGEQFQRETKYERGNLPGSRLEWNKKPETYKWYPDAPRLTLSRPVTTGGAPLWEVIAKRRSVRRYHGEPVTEAELSQLLWACQGITARRANIELRAAPSAGALYPVETYVAVHDVARVDPGIYHYGVPDHVLEQLRAGDFRQRVARAALDQRIAATANLVIIWTGVFPRSRWKYRQRAYRYIYLDAGHIAQNAALAAVGSGLATCQIAALYDDEVNELLGIDGDEESTIYMTVVGRSGDG
jgi:SagB-type dehydrogenase family enzyme